jgi:hypothetical protein
MPRNRYRRRRRLREFYCPRPNDAVVECGVCTRTFEQKGNVTESSVQKRIVRNKNTTTSFLYYKSPAQCKKWQEQYPKVVFFGPSPASWWRCSPLCACLPHICIPLQTKAILYALVLLTEKNYVIDSVAGLIGLYTDGGTNWAAECKAWLSIMAHSILIGSHQTSNQK